MRLLIVGSLNGQIGAASQIADFSYIHLGQCQRDIAGNSRNAEQVYFRACKGQQNGNSVVLAGIGINDK